MPFGDCTGPWWAQGNGWNGFRRGFRGRGYGFYYNQAWNQPSNTTDINPLLKEIEELKARIDELQRKLNQ